jgi:hypothetical protein
MSGLTLFDIERGLHEALTVWQEADTAEELEAAELALRTYAELELRKADGYITTIRAMEAAETLAKCERDRQASRAKSIHARIDWLKQFAGSCMSAWGKKRIEGKLGALTLRGNGGVQPLTITNPALVPDELCTVTITFRADSAIVKQAIREGAPVGERTPHNALIREALGKPCARCKGDGLDWNPDQPGPKIDENSIVVCPDCNGTKTASVPGCRLEPRGESVVIR